MKFSNIMFFYIQELVLKHAKNFESICFAWSNSLNTFYMTKFQSSHLAYTQGKSCQCMSMLGNEEAPYWFQVLFARWTKSVWCHGETSLEACHPSTVSRWIQYACWIAIHLQWNNKQYVSNCLWAIIAWNPETQELKSTSTSSCKDSSLLWLVLKKQSGVICLPSQPYLLKSSHFFTCTQDGGPELCNSVVFPFLMPSNRCIWKSAKLVMKHCWLTPLFI